MNIPKLLTSLKVQLLIISILTGFSFSNIFQNQFATDDIGYFYNWQIPKHFENIPKIFTQDSVPLDEKGVYRPVKALAIMVVYKVWGLNVVGYHLVGLMVHLLCTVLVYLITLEIIQNVRYREFSKEKPKFKGQNYNSKLKSEKKSIIHNTYSIIPFITALLFGVHPIHTEAITFILA